MILRVGSPNHPVIIVLQLRGSRLLVSQTYELDRINLVYTSWDQPAMWRKINLDAARSFERPHEHGYGAGDI